MMYRRGILFATLAVLPMCGQTPDPTASLQFEVAVMKPTVDTTVPGLIVHLPGERGYRGVNMPLISYLNVAYQVRPDQITLPDNAPAGNFDMEGKADRTCTADELHLMLQHLLEERFHIQMHRGTKELNGYSLVVEKGGPKLTDHDPEDKTMLPLLLGSGPHKGTNVSMQYLAFFLSQQLGQTVVDKTGLTGHYDFDLTWQMEGMPMMMSDGGPPPPMVPGPPPPQGPGPMMMAATPSAAIFEALRKQLGLRLDKAKVPSVQIIIDHMEKLADN
jgi:uncharacterized protein (TIGR03435 family)